MGHNQLWRTWLLGAVLTVTLLILVIRLAQFQLFEHRAYKDAADNWLTRRTMLQPSRGAIHDINGNVLAGAGNEYQVGLDLPFITVDIETLTADIAEYVGWDAQLLENTVNDYLDDGLPYIHLANRISQESADAIKALDYNGVALPPVPRRQYPEGSLLCHALGYVDFEGVSGGGLEQYYHTDLQGEAFASLYFDVPSNPRIATNARRGRDLVLTIDRHVQQAVELHLAEAIDTYDADSGSIIVLNPKTGAVVAMANAPCFDPYRFNETAAWKFTNPIVSNLYEPGSVMKLITMAAGIESGVITPGTEYIDKGFVNSGGFRIYNASEKIYGRVDTTDILVNSINTGTVHVAELIGADDYYSYIEKFGFGRPTGIDLASEASGSVIRPTNEGWTETTLANNAFGQSIAVTPLQMAASVAAIANDGKLMQPYIVHEMVEDGVTYTRREPQPASIPLSKKTARQITAMAIQVGDLYDLHLDGYTVAGKTGTAQIPVPESGIYHPTDVIASFGGWLPANDPELLILVKLDRPKNASWGSESAAPTFKKVAEELVTLMDITPDSERINTP